MKLLQSILDQPGFTPWLLVVGLVMYLAWTAAYLDIIRRGFRDRSYGVPMASLGFNVVWEFFFSFNVVGSDLFWFFVWGNRLWFVFDVIIVMQLLLYGREVQRVPFLRRFFYPAVVTGLVLSAWGLYTFSFYFGDIQGAASSMTMNFVMSILYIGLLFQRPDLRGLSYPAAWLKMIGTLGGSVFLYFWWPAQFEQGELRGHPGVHEPPTYSWMLFLYTGILFFDCVYIALFRQRRRELREAGA